VNASQEQWPGEAADPEEAEPDVGEVEAEDLVEGEDDEDTGEEPELRIAGHQDGELDIPDDVAVLEGEARSTRRGVGIVVARADSETANALLAAALAELDRAGVARDNVMVMAVPGPFELPIGAMALAKTRRYACIVALGSASGLVAGEAASGLQLAGLETGIPVAFGVLTDGGAEAEQGGAEAVRHALEMADLFHQLRSAAQAAK
jgi:6,7-dimethyl-8-ribityllumazine synthase